MRRRALASRFLPRALILAVLVSAALSTGLVPIHVAEPVRAGTAETMESALLGWINTARAARGLGRLRVGVQLADLAGERVTILAAQNVLSHTVPGCLKCQLADRGVAWDGYGEVLASNSWTWGLESARTAFDGWKGSPTHWNILMGATMDTVGIAVAVAANGTTYAGAILVDTPGYVAEPEPKAAPAAAPAPRAKVPATPAPTPVPEPVSIPGPTARYAVTSL
ncbi:MAG: CAP domain-containing protein [Chloroflexota bacterium]